MLLSSSHHRCGDQFVRQNSEKAPAPHPASPTPPQSHTPTDFFLTQIQCNSHISETSCATPASIQLEPACLGNRKQEERAQSRSPPLPNHQSLRDLHSFPSSHEPPETDPAFIQALWSEVICSESTQNPSKNLLGINMMGSSAGRVPAEYDPQGFSSSAFSGVLKRHQVTIKEDVEVLSNLVVPSFWRRIREAVKAAPAEVSSELESCKVWENNDEGIEAKATADIEAYAEDLAARLKALVVDRDSVQVDHHQFITLQILHSCPLLGVRVFNNLKMLEVATEPYHLISTRESSTVSISTQPIAGQSTRPTSSTAPSTSSAYTAPRRSAMQNAAQPTKIDPATLRKLNLPRDMLDCAYWLEASELQPLSATWIARHTFVSTGTNRKTSPYLSIAFENSECGSFTEKKLLVKHKIAVYGSTALYNRHLLYTKVLKIGRNGRNSITQVDRSVYILHFGLVIIGEEATLYVFRCEEENPRKTGQATAWHGCNMSKVGQWNLTAPNELADMLYHLRIVADWVKRVYVPVLRDDLTQLFDSLGH